eukprot:46045-Rhodomonas_salina.5
MAATDLAYPLPGGARDPRPRDGRDDGLRRGFLIEGGRFSQEIHLLGNPHPSQRRAATSDGFAVPYKDSSGLGSGSGSGTSSSKQEKRSSAFGTSERSFCRLSARARAAGGEFLSFTRQTSSKRKTNLKQQTLLPLSSTRLTTLPETCTLRRGTRLPGPVRASLIQEDQAVNVPRRACAACRCRTPERGRSTARPLGPAGRHFSTYAQLTNLRPAGRTPGTTRAVAVARRARACAAHIAHHMSNVARLTPHITRRASRIARHRTPHTAHRAKSHIAHPTHHIANHKHASEIKHRASHGMITSRHRTVHRTAQHSRAEQSRAQHSTTTDGASHTTNGTGRW